ncbi:predicted protein [Naegleria gruberi]|uniref:Predicted protein n=1 Tax=Naegleria gruberi TaxID=5762 RepID=D2V1F1_NAEGR|nr:uncharacterized protein NAEGRDRAFT_45872 [Naegleria gruberi]EFC49294.1 predicted protein [Naegleria gruberi]|eukprot:XP_002682038.1 predicted protein [Naegleria gruberi strain NEG-M]
MPIVVFSSAHAAKSILIDNWKDFPKDGKLRTPQQEEFIGKSLVFMNGTEWKVNRSVLNPPFQHVDKYWNIFSEKVNYCVSNLQQYSKEGQSENKFPLKIKDVISRMALDVIGESALDCDFNYLDPNFRLSDTSQSQDSSQNEKVLQAFRFVFKNINSWERMLGGKLYSSLPIIDNHRMEKSIRIMHEFVSSIIEKKRIEHVDRRVIDVVHPSMESAMDLMIEANQAFHEPKPSETKPAIPSNFEPAHEEEEEQVEPLKISDKNLKDNTLLLFLAGHATTADALSFLLLNLALNERVQDTLYKELKEAYPDRFKIREGKYCEFIIQQLDDLATLHKLPYLDCVINENLRISPPVGVLNRVSKKSHIIDGVKISKDQSIALSIKSIHYNTELWGEKSDEFYPERFANYSSTERHEEENVSSHHPICSFLPFGLGARSCLGSKFSILEQKVFIVHLLSKYLVKLPEEYQMKEKVGLGEFAHLMIGAGPLSSLGEELKLEFVERVEGISENVSDLIEEESNRMESAINEPTPNLYASSTATDQFVREENKEFPQYNVNREELIRSLP